MVKKTWEWLKSGWGFLVALFFGFFLIKRGIDKKVLEEMSIEKAKEDAQKYKINLEEQVEKAEIELKYDKQKEQLQQDLKYKKENLVEENKALEDQIKEQLKNNPDEFGQKFAEKFNLNYDKGKK